MKNKKQKGRAGSKATVASPKTNSSPLSWGRGLGVGINIDFLKTFLKKYNKN